MWKISVDLETKKIAYFKSFILKKNNKNKAISRVALQCPTYQSAGDSVSNLASY